MVAAYWLIGQAIVEEEQQGEGRAAYGAGLIKELSERLTERYGKGFSTTNLAYFRQFYLAFPQRTIPIFHTPGGELENATQRVENSAQGFHTNLSWSHYRALMRVENMRARDFYEAEAADQRWSVRQLERQIHSLYYERLLKSTDKAGMMRDSRAEMPPVLRPVNVIKDPYVLEFLDLPAPPKLTESDLEAALIDKLHDFLLELGAGFAFVGRQQRLTLDGDHFYPDLVFYHIRLKCYVIIDLKTGKLTHGDLGQMQLYVNYYDREVADADDNPTVGLLLCAAKNDAVVRYVLGEANDTIFASRYKLALPDEQQLAEELRHEMALLIALKGEG